MKHTAKNFEQLNTLVDFTSFITSTLDTGEIRKRAIKAAVELLDVEAGSLILVDQETGELFFEVALGDRGEKVKEVRLKKGEGIAGWVAEKGEALIVNDAQSDRRFFKAADEHSSFATKSILCVPVKSKEKVLGVLEALNKKHGVFDEEDKQALMALSNQVAVAIENANLYQEVKEREDRFRAIIDTVPDAVLILDTEGKIYHWNTSAERIFGFSSEEARGKQLHKLIAPHDVYDAYVAFLTHVKLLTHFKDTGRGPAVGITSEFFAIRKDKTKLPIEISTSAIQIKGTWHAIITIRDITERKRVENALSENEKRFRELYEKAPLGIHSLDKDGRIIDVNQSWVDMLGYPQEEVIGRSFSDFMTPQSAQLFVEHFSRLKSEGKMKDVEYELIHSEGAQVIVSIHGRVFFDKKGAFKHTQCILNDITERKQTEGFFKSAYAEIEQAYSGLELTVKERTKELTEANRKLQELDRLKSMFIASMSHELRTPLNSVIGFSSILLNEWVGPLNPEQKENLSTILKAGKHLLALITDVIDVSKIEAGTIDFQASDFDLYDVMKEVVNLFPQEIKEKELEFKSEPIHQMLYTDRRRLLQCLINLTSNAIKFTEQGSISLTARKISDNGHIELAVSDTGFGIKEEDLSKLFLSFSRINSSLKKTIPGTGLGLYLTKKLVTEILKGEISVKSTHGMGSTFTIKIPLKIS